jgi:unsaturated rhamnogalacturonyl hydrolase
MLTDYLDAYAAAYQPYKDGAFCYEDGCLYRGLIVLSEATDDPRWERHLQRLLGAQVAEDGTLAGYDPAEFNIDNILSGRALLHLHRRTGEARWLRGAERLAAQLDRHPRTRSGVYWHKQIYPWQVWLDGLYMGLPFQIAFGQAADRPDLIADALEQLRAALALTWNPATRLHAHGYDEARAQPWADAQSGRSSAHWARAMGWLAMCLADTAELVGPRAFEAEGLGGTTRPLAARLAELATPGGLWLQVIDAPGLPGNYEESSASAMFAYALMRLDRLGIVPGASGVGLRAFEALAEQVGANGGVLPAVCHVAGLGGFNGRYRDGTQDYYVAEAIRPDDVKGVGPLMMAAGEAERRAAHRAEGVRGAAAG